MVKIGKYHINAFKISLYFFLLISAVILLVNFILFSVQENYREHFTVHFVEHLIFTLLGSVVIYFLLSKDMFVKNQFSQLIKDEEKKYQVLFENANDAILLLRDEYIIDCNLRSCEIFNCKKHDLVGKSFLKLSSESKNAETLHELIKKSSSQPQYFEWEYTRCDKASFEAEVSLNQVDMSGFLFTQVFIKDISALKHSQKAFSESEEKFKTIFNTVSDGILIFTAENEILEVNDIILKRYGLTREQLIGFPEMSLIPQAILQTVQKHVPDLNHQDNVIFEVEGVQALHQTISLEMRLAKIFLDGKEAYIAMGRDISQRKLNQRIVYNAVIQTEEQERSRVAKELHDGVSPILSAAKLYAQSLRDCSNENLKGNILRMLENTIDESIQSISEISNNLSPHILQNFGLTAAVQSFVDKLRSLNGPTIQINSNWKGRLEENFEVTLYRVIIELINNSIKHSGAETINIDINKEKDIQLTYSDNGKGFNVKETLDKKKGMGLFNIINRVKSLNGTIDYFSAPGDGFKVIVKFGL